MTEGALPLAEGDVGEAVADLQHRLEDLELGPLTDPVGTFGPSTRGVVEQFQRLRGLRIDGVVGPSTWATLVEAGLHLGARLLYRTHPMLRGDDVADLQSRLCSLGFDTGRVDGIFGDQTAGALVEFQRNLGLPTDAMAGPATLAELLRVTARHGATQLVTAVREREARRQSPTTLLGRHLGVGEVGGLGTLATGVARLLRRAGARISLLHHPEDHGQAAEANEAGVEAYVGLRLHPDAPLTGVAYYSGYSYESAAGRDLAEALAAELGPLVGGNVAATGMSLTLLRETRMPAVLVELGPTELVVERAGALAQALVDAVVRWAEAGADQN
jgi:N-acetylmuramoyl-L-alanine amidase